MGLVELLQDAFWRKVLKDVPQKVAVFAYSTLNGMAAEEALSLIHERPADPRALRRLIGQYQRLSKPVYAASFLEQGISKHWMARTIRNIADDPEVAAGDRLNAIALAIRLSGAEATVTRETIYQDGSPERTTIRETISAAIDQELGHLLIIPREAATIVEAEPETQLISPREE